MTRWMALLFLAISFLLVPQLSLAACDYPWQTDSLGRKCGGRAASVIPGGRLGGDGKYEDSFGRPRVYGPNNDPYDKPSYNFTPKRQPSSYPSPFNYEYNLENNW